MSKIAAIGAWLAANAATVAAVTTAAGAAATGYGLHKQQQLAKDQKAAQEKANEEWLDYQEAERLRFQEIEDRERQNATDEVLDFAKEGDIGNRMEEIDTEANRLTSAMEARSTPAVPVADTLASVPEEGGIRENLGRSLAKATADSRARMQALARIGGYGVHMANRGTAARDTSREVGNINDVRKGALIGLQRAQSIPPEQFVSGDTGLAAGLVDLGTQAMGYGMGQMSPLETGAPIRPKPRPKPFTSVV